MKIIDLPIKVTKLLEELDSPERLNRHLQIVHSIANKLLSLLKQEWPKITFNTELILFGAATHDIGKIEVRNELFEIGKKHELIGEKILINLGFSKEKSRFAFTHGNWKEDNLKLEDLLVSLSDKIWKGKRVHELEEKIGHVIANKLEIDYWIVYEKLDKILEQVSSGADERIVWQNQ